MTQYIIRTIDVEIKPTRDVDVGFVEYDKADDQVLVVIGKYVKGEKGDVPERGVDYWTDEDVQEFKDYCVDVITQQWFGTEAQYEKLLRDGEVLEDWIYFIYEDQGENNSSYIEGDTLVVNGAVLLDNNTTVQLYGYLEDINTTLVLDNSI